jgi:hypothetical protein
MEDGDEIDAMVEQHGGKNSSWANNYNQERII